MKIFKKVMATLMILSLAAGTFFSLDIASSAEEKKSILYGDVTNDGMVNSFDALTLLKHITEFEKLTAERLKAADVNNDKKVNTEDALYILEYAAGIITRFPVDLDGPTELIPILLGYYYDPASGMVIDNQGRGLLGFGYDAKNGVFYATNNAWQRNFGYTELYDVAAPLVMIAYDTTRIFFEYGDNEYMVQLWKGQYGMVLIGCEIGVYYRPKGDTSFMDSSGRKLYYCCDDEMLFKMKLDLSRDNTVILSRPEQYSWWLTGFVPGQLSTLGYYTPETTQVLGLTAQISFTDKGMMNAFIEGLKKTTDIFHNATKDIRKIKYELNKTYFIDGSKNAVTFKWK